MLGNILEIRDDKIIVKLAIDINKQPNLVSLHVVFEDNSKKIVAQIDNVSLDVMTVSVVGEFVNDAFVPGISKRPSFKSIVRLIRLDELEKVFGSQNLVRGYTNFGTSNVYDGYKINININDFFNNHFSIFGNTGAGKSCAVSSILQKLFANKETAPINSNFFFFDAYGEYSNAFSQLNKINPLLNYKVYTTNTNASDDLLLRIPPWLLDVDDLALLLDATNPTQLPIIEKTLSLVTILTGNSSKVIKKKNDIIARALQDILLSGNDSTKIRDQVVAVLTKFNTPELNLESQIVQPGYTRTLKQCLYIDKTGKMQEMELVVEFIRGYINDSLEDISDSEKNLFYNLADLELAMDFALVNEGILKSEKVFDYANILSVRLHTLVNGEYGKYFNYSRFVNRKQYIDELLTSPTGAKCQIVNFNINYVDDRVAKVITKILSRMLFLRASEISPRGSAAFHILIEEAHRYVTKDTDMDLLGYNIFERITKEGRKYGVFLGLITQRPSELSDTCISQCTNFVILRMLHPKDLEYIKNMVPNISAEIVKQLKSLKPGNCIAFGSAFKVPISMYIDLPNPRPMSDNVNLVDVWYRPITNVSIGTNYQPNIINQPQLVNGITSPTILSSEVVSNG